MRVPNQDKIVYVHGERVRTEDPQTGRVTIRQCDLHRTLELDAGGRTYRVLPIMAKPADPLPQTLAANQVQSCKATPRREVEETGEVQQMFGMEAQRIRFFIYEDPVPDSCPDGRLHRSFLGQERDGWYVEVPPVPECPARTERDRLGLDPFLGPDQYVRSDGSLSPVLLPVKLTVRIPSGPQGMKVHTRRRFRSFLPRPSTPLYLMFRRTIALPSGIAPIKTRAPEILQMELRCIARDAA